MNECLDLQQEKKVRKKMTIEDSQMDAFAFLFRYIYFANIILLHLRERESKKTKKGKAVNSGSQFGT